MQSWKRVLPLLASLATFLLCISPSRAQAPNGWIQDSNWVLLGPLGSSGGCDPGAAAGSNWIAPEEISTITPGDGDPLDIDFTASASTSWQGAADSPTWLCLGTLGLPGSDLVDMEQVAAALSASSGKAIPTTQSMAVLVTYVTNDGPDPLPVELCSASDDSIQIWVNDQKVQEVHACRGTAAGCAETAPALLVPGTNAVKVLLWQGDGGWSFRIQLERLGGGSITSADPGIHFGCDNAGAVALDAYRIQRRLLVDVPACAVPGGAVDVVLDGDSTPGPAVNITELITGAVTVENISAGGSFTPAPGPVMNPVGMFDGSADVGTPCTPGSTVLNGDGSYTVSGSGLDIWQTGDQFQFAYKLAHGDFSLTAHVASAVWAPGSRWGKAGIMARQSVSGAARYAMIQTHGEDLEDQDRFAGRPTHGGSDNFEQTNLAGGEHREWMRLERIGSLFVGSFSTDGLSWEPAGSMDWGLSAPHTVLLGLGVTSHAGCDSSSLTFDQLTLTGGNQDPGPLPADGGTLVWNAIPRATVDLGLGYRLRGQDQVTLFGHDGQHVIEGRADLFLQGTQSGAGIFTSAHDIGGPCAAGSTLFDPQAGSYAVTGGGNDIWVGDDQFQYAYSRVKGNFSARAHVQDRNWAAGVRWGKGGLMARETCEPDSRYSFLHDSPEPDNTRYAIQRVSGQASNQEFGLGGHPDWLRLDRVGDVFAGYSSDDGVVWTLRYKEAWIAPVPELVLVGLALTSHGGCTASTVTFDQLSVSPIDYSVTRTAGDGLAGCPSPTGGASVKVVLQGSGPAGPNVLLNEEVHGQVDVKNISNGGIFTPVKKPAYQPVGIWADARDIGAPCLPGTTVDNNDGSYTLTGSGVDIWQTGDQFQYAYVEASGDFKLTCRIAVRDWAAGSRWGKVGLMARQSRDPFSRYVSVQDHGADPQDPTRWAARPTHGGTDNYETVPLGAGEHHDWLQLERTGDLFIGSSSLDGVDWIEQGRQAWTQAPATVLLGLEVCSHMDCSPSSITFDSIDYQGGNGPPGSVPDGGLISWNVPRATLSTGVSYQLSSAANSFASFEGTADGVAVNGDNSYSLALVEQIAGDLPVAHDVGNPCASGSSSFDPTTSSYTITGSGSDIWQGGDQFQYAYREVTGDYFVAVVHIAERQWAPASRWGKVGIMARQDCTPRSRYAMMQDHGEDQQDQTRFAARPTQGGADNFEQFLLPAGVHRDWLRLDRSGSLFTGYTSNDGQNWEREGSVDFGPTAPPQVLLGLAVCSHTGCAPTTIVFDNLQIVTQANHPPAACIETDPSPPNVALTGGKAEVTLKGTCSSDGDGGTQTLSYLWSRTGGPSGLSFDDRTQAVTRVVFTKLGTYKLKLTVNDGQVSNNLASATVDVVVSEQAAGPLFRRGDADANGLLELTDAVRLLNYLFLGGLKPECLDAADFDDNGQADISDAISNLLFQFLGGPAPASPGPAVCGPDANVETPDLGCDVGCR